MKTLYKTAGTEPACPNCGNWNAMLRKGRQVGEDWVDDIECRDCGLKYLHGEFKVEQVNGSEMPCGK